MSSGGVACYMTVINMENCGLVPVTKRVVTSIVGSLILANWRWASFWLEVNLEYLEVGDI